MAGERLGSGWLTRRSARARGAAGGTLEAAPEASRPPAEPADLVAMLRAFSRMVATVEQQSTELNHLSLRLENAYRDLESTNARLKELSFKDEVTGLYNRRFFSIRLEEEVLRFRRFSHPVSLVLLDLDGFKEVNDKLGHAVGDTVLRATADVLLRYSRGINVICRYGGDEFAVLLVETSKAGARLYADRIRQVLADHVSPHGHQITASIGVASLPEDAAPGAEDLLHAADDVLYAAKRAGKNRVLAYDDAAPVNEAPPTGAEPS